MAPSSKTSSPLVDIEHKLGRLFWIAIAGAAFLAVTLITYRSTFVGPLSHDQAVWGQFGDFVGGTLNPILSFLSLIALLWTISLQTRELRLSSIELHNTAEAMRVQNGMLKIEAFEATFFQMLRLHNEIVSSIDIAGTPVIRGRDCFRVFLRRLRDSMDATHGSFEDVQRLKIAYATFRKTNDHELAHYFRLLYHTIKFVDRSDIIEKRIYTNLVRAQLSSNETLLLFFNCLSDSGDKKFKLLIEKYALLKTMPQHELATASLRSHFSATAYGSAGSHGQDAAEPSHGR